MPATSCLPSAIHHFLPALCTSCVYVYLTIYACYWFCLPTSSCSPLRAARWRAPHRAAPRCALPRRAARRAAPLPLPLPLRHACCLPLLRCARTAAAACRLPRACRAALPALRARAPLPHLPATARAPLPHRCLAASRAGATPAAAHAHAHFAARALCVLVFTPLPLPLPTLCPFAFVCLACLPTPWLVLPLPSPCLPAFCLPLPALQFPSCHHPTTTCTHTCLCLPGLPALCLPAVHPSACLDSTHPVLFPCPSLAATCSLCYRILHTRIALALPCACHCLPCNLPLLPAACLAAGFYRI